MEQRFKSEYYNVEVEATQRLVRIKRLPTNFPSADEMARGHKELLRAIAPYVGFKLLLDVREGPARSDPEYEVGASQMRKQIVTRFERAAVLVRSAVGRLQVQRLAKDDGVALQVFQDEKAALEHLRIWPRESS